MLAFLASYGLREIVIFSTVWIAIGISLWLVHPAAAVFPAMLLIFTLYFFRDPSRRIPPEANALVAPADGRVVEISEAEETEFLKTPCYKIGIFLSVFDVHINRAPCDGIVHATRHQPGRFLDARHPDSGKVNESNAIHIGDVLVRQIAGAIARRIVCAVRPEDVLKRGQKFGMIKFGSRTELYVPKARVEKIEVRMNEKVKGGQTVIARIR